MVTHPTIPHGEGVGISLITNVIPFSKVTLGKYFYSNFNIRAYFPGALDMSTLFFLKAIDAHST